MTDEAPKAPPSENAPRLEEKQEGQGAADASAGDVQSSALSTTGASPAFDWSGPALEFMKVWASSWEAVLGQIAGGGMHCDLSSTPPPDTLPTDTDILMIAAIMGGLRGEMSLRMPQTSALRSACLLLGEPAAEGIEFSSERREAFEELLRQISGHVATALKSRWGDVQLRWETGSPATWAEAATGWLVVRSDSGWSAATEWQLSAALHASLVSEANTSPDARSVEPAAAVPIESVSPLLASEQLNLILDVELALTLRFGTKSLLLQDILQLNAGSVVELDRQVQDPVELLLDGRLIARGEVVVVDGNYGLRVQEVFSPSSTI